MPFVSVIVYYAVLYVLIFCASQAKLIRDGKAVEKQPMWLDGLQDGLFVIDEAHISRQWYFVSDCY